MSNDYEKIRRSPRVDCNLEGKLIFDFFDEPEVQATITQLSEVGALLIPELPINTHSVFVLNFSLPNGEVRMVCRVLRQHLTRDTQIAVEFENPENITHALTSYVDEMFVKNGPSNYQLPTTDSLPAKDI